MVCCHCLWLAQTSHLDFSHACGLLGFLLDIEVEVSQSEHEGIRE